MAAKTRERGNGTADRDTVVERTNGTASRDTGWNERTERLVGSRGGTRERNGGQGHGGWNSAQGHGRLNKGTNRWKGPRGGINEGNLLGLMKSKFIPGVFIRLSRARERGPRKFLSLHYVLKTPDDRKEIYNGLRLILTGISAFARPKQSVEEPRIR